MFKLASWQGFKYQTKRWFNIVMGVGLSVGIIVGLSIDIYLQNIKEVEAQELTATTTPKEVLVEVVIDWTPERIEQEIRNTFVEEPNTAVAIVKAEGGLRVKVQSHYVNDGIQEPSFCAFQIHEPSWDREARRLGYEDYKTNPAHCVAMAYHIYKSAGHTWTDWSAYKNGSYKRYL